MEFGMTTQKTDMFILLRDSQRTNARIETT